MVSLRFGWLLLRHGLALSRSLLSSLGVLRPHKFTHCGASRCEPIPNLLLQSGSEPVEEKRSASATLAGYPCRLLSTPPNPQTAVISGRSGARLLRLIPGGSAVSQAGCKPLLVAVGDLDRAGWCVISSRSSGGHAQCQAWHMSREAEAHF